ncbi:MAG: hypothetical protein AAGH15_06555, partial [Myxococcota bacterium]
MTRCLPLCCVILACGSPAPPPAPEPPAFDEEAVEGSVRAAFAAFTEAVAAGELEAAGAFYALNPQFAWYEDGELRYPNAQAARAALQGLAQMGPVSVTYGEPDVVALAPDWASLSATFATRVGEGERAFAFEGVQTMLLFLDGERWVALRGHTSTKRPPPAGEGEWGGGE